MALGKSPAEIVASGEYQLLAIAPHWKRIPLGEVVTVQNGFAFSSKLFTHDSGMPLIRIRDVKRDYTENFYEGDYDTEYVVRKGDLLIGMDGDFYAAIWKGPEGLLNQRVCRLIQDTELYSPGFLFLVLQPYLNAINAETSSVTVKHLSSRTVSEIPLPLPPLAEQKRIVAKIEELFSELDAGEESLRRARRQLGVYRQSLLKQAFEGKLTAPWRAQHPDLLESPDQLLARIQEERETRYEERLREWEKAVAIWEKKGKSGKKPAKPREPKPATPIPEEDLSELPTLPAEWIWGTIETTCDVVRGGSPRPAGDPKYYDGDIPFLKVADLTRVDGPYLDRFTATIKEAGLQKTRFVEPPVLMISNSGATLGVPRICRIAATFNDGIAAFLDLEPATHHYFYYYWESKTRALRNIDQGAAQPNLNTDLLKNYPAPLCSLPEQQQIVRLLDEQFEAIEQNEREIDAALKRSEALRQSILKKAFTGQLVPQDPEDEPASELLARIREEREESGRMKPAAKKRTTKKARQ